MPKISYYPQKFIIFRTLTLIIITASLLFSPVHLFAEEPTLTPDPTPTSTPIPTGKPIRNNTVGPINIRARSSVLLNATTLDLLYEKNSRQPVPIASTTKIMTAIVVLENYQPQTVIKVPKKAVRQIGTKMGLKTHEKITVENLLWGMMLPSGNDAAFTLAGLANLRNPNSQKTFVRKMNAKTVILGLTDTRFYDSAGLNDAGHSSAYDLAVLTAYALKNPTFANIVSTRSKTVRSVNRKQKHNLKNTNLLIQPNESNYLSSAIGVKTGWTGAAGSCLVSATRQNNITLISVVLHPNQLRAKEASRLSNLLLSWGYNAYIWPNG